MRIATEDIKPVPTEIHFVENVQEINRLLGQEGEADYRAIAPLQVDVTHVRSGDDLLFSGEVQGELVGQCGRCLEEYALSLTRSFSVVLTPRPPLGREMELSYDELSASFYHGEMIDVSALIQEQTQLALPSTPLCRVDCKGLCPQCGANRNVNPCACRPEWREPRLAILSSLQLSRSRAEK
ncbi:MAG: DUF177 domain-containing protein [Deltaproteobacteria bacterium]|nr:DUF177 domain-containing protein [Deltaproteobacteria bacterium]